MTIGISKTNIAVVCTAILLTGCSFKEDRTDVVVPIVDAFPSQPQSGLNDQNSRTSFEGYTYVVKYGDTLGTIAQEYLGSSSRYTELLRLNNLKKNGSIYVGQRLKLPVEGLRKIPGTEAAKQVTSKADQQNSASITPDNESYPELEKLLEKQQFNQAIQWVLSQEDLSASQVLQQKLLFATKSQVKIYKQEQNITDAETLLSGLIANEAIRPSNKRTLENELSLLRAEQGLVAAKRYADNEDFDEAYTILLDSWQKVGKPLENNILFTGTRNTVSEHYHQKALRHYRNQELDQALAFWQKILALNPNDDLALVYRDRVIALQNKLDNL
nr:LysM domain-containing protein [Kangiella sediminilitoris]